MWPLKSKVNVQEHKLFHPFWVRHSVDSLPLQWSIEVRKKKANTSIPPGIRDPLSHWQPEKSLIFCQTFFTKGRL